MLHIVDAKTVLVVTAHPDDEAFLAAGTIQRIVDAGGRVTLACATRGERGRAWTDLSSEVLASVREQELRAASQLLGVHHTTVFGLPDGALVSHEVELARMVDTLLRAVSPEVVLTFGPDGYTGHADHCATHRAVQGIAHQSGIPCAFFAHPPEPWRAEMRAVLAKKRMHGVYDADEGWGGPMHAIAVNPERKYAVLQAHQTQFPGLDPYWLFSAACAEHFLSHEYIAWSA